ncbi:MAG: cell division protein FtsZ [Candidatus Adiutrix sp.]|jgi:cell division protein FtsZ|nr:cell division protein FtsZ [Candidatus Adiutrix sp.]
MEEFVFQDTKVLHKIKVFGIGGGGNNAINNMIKEGVTGPVFVAANSDMQDLERSLAPHKVQVGSQLTKGLGCGGKADVGRLAAQEDMERIKDTLADSDMVFIAAGMGGGTGSGGAPVVAEALSRLNNPPLIVGVVTKPFKFEGARRMKQAQEAIAELTQHCHSILVVPNEKLRATMPPGSSLQDAYHEADTVLLKAVQGITDLITGKGLVNVDFRDLTTVMTKRGPTIMGMGQASGEDRAIKAAKQAISSPLLDDLSITGAQGILISITGPSDVGMEEIVEICELITAEAHPDAEIFHGVAFDETLRADGQIKVMVIATGLGGAAQAAPVQPHEAPEIMPPTEETPALPAAAVGQIIDYHQQARGPVQAGYGQLTGEASGGRRIHRRHSGLPGDSIAFDDVLMDIPTYLRRKAD